MCNTVKLEAEKSATETKQTRLEEKKDGAKR